MKQYKQKIIGWLWILYCLCICSSCLHTTEEDGFIQIFDGETLSGWEGDPTYWSVENGHLVGTLTPETLLERNSFIIWQEGTPEDFELKLDYLISKEGNSGINYRSEKVDDIPYALRGYQFDIDGNNYYTGQNYEERGRTTLAHRGQSVILEPLPDSLTNMPLSVHVKNNAWTKAIVTNSTGSDEELESHIKENDWNTCHLIVRGNKMQHYLNGLLMSEVIDNDIQNRKTRGHIGFQVHVGPPMKVKYRNIRIKIHKSPNFP